MRRLSAGALGVLLLAGCGGGGEDGDAQKPEPTVLEQAYETCVDQVDESLAAYDGDGADAPTAADTISIEDQGRRLSVLTPDPGGDLMAGEAFTTAQCVLDETGAPSSVGQKMASASALSGPATDSWAAIEAEWSYAAGMDASGFQAFFKVVE